MAGARVGARGGRARSEKIFPSPHRICGRNAMSPSAVSSAYQGLGNGAGLVSSGRNLYPLSPLQFLATSPQKLMCHHINAHETLMKRCTGNSLRGKRGWLINPCGRHLGWDPRGGLARFEFCAACILPSRNVIMHCTRSTLHNHFFSHPSFHVHVLYSKSLGSALAAPLSPYLVAEFKISKLSH